MVFKIHRWLQLCGCVVVCWIVGACVSNAGIAQFEVYRSAFEKADSTGQSILNQLAHAERFLFQKQFPAYKTTDDIPGFSAIHAAYYSESVDPPGTAAFRRSLSAVRSYNELLYALSSGQTAATMNARLVGFISSGENAIREIQKVQSVGQTVSGQLARLLTVTGKLSTYFADVQPITGAVFDYRSKEVFRSYLISARVPVLGILEELRNGTKEIFPVLTYKTELSANTVKNGYKLTESDIQRIELYRKLLSEWVLLLDHTHIALDDAVYSISGSTMTQYQQLRLFQSATDLEKVADSAQNHLVKISAL